MRILYLIDTLGAGGKERRLTELIKKIVNEKEFDFELVILSNEIQYKEVLNLGITVHQFIRKTKKDISVFFRIYDLCKKFKPDIVHCWDSMTAVYLAPICKLLKIKLINGMVVDCPVKRNITNKYWLRAKLTFPLSDFIVGNSKAGLEAYKAPTRKSDVIYNGFNFERLNNITPAAVIKEKYDIKTKYTIGMVASFSEKKDYPTYYEAAKLILKYRRDITFLAIGNGTDSIDSKDLVGKEFIEYFRLLGRRSGIESLVNVMDICILSTFTEGISNSILEYMALKKPVIATKCGGTGEIIIDQQNGFLVDPVNPRKLAEKMELLLNNIQLRENMGFAAEKHVRERFSIDQMADKYIDLYRRLYK